MAKQFKGIAQQFINAMKQQFIGMGADAKNIFVQDLYDYAPKHPEGTGMSGLGLNQAYIG